MTDARENADARALPLELTPGSAMFGLGYAPPFMARQFSRLVNDAAQDEKAGVAEEVPTAFVYNARSHVVMMATPADLEDFAYGFSLSEGVVRHATDITHVDVVRHSRGIELQMTVAPDVAARLGDRNRALVGRTGCGVCGVESIQEALRPLPHVPKSPPLSIASLWRAESSLGDAQQWNRETGAMHAAGWAARDGQLHVVREDVGRHNALDKVLGALARSGQDPSTGFVVMTSRASYELVQKVAMAGVSLLATISRPTGLAIRLAEDAGVTLVGLLRGRTANVYSHPDGLRLESAIPASVESEGPSSTTGGAR